MAPPVLSPAARIAALERAQQVRAERAHIKQLLKQGTTTLPDVLAEAANSDAIAKMKVLVLLQSMPGVGKVKAAEIMGRIGIAENRRVAGLGSNQRQQLEAEFAAA